MHTDAGEALYIWQTLGKQKEWLPGNPEQVQIDHFLFDVRKVVQVIHFTGTEWKLVMLQ